VISEYDKINLEATKASYEAGKVATLSGPIVNALTNLSVSIVGIVSGFLYLYERITLGALTSFMLYSRRFSGPINQISNLIADIQSSLAACERIFAYIDFEYETIDEAKDLEKLDSKISHEVSTNDLSFAYVPNVLVLKSLNFVAEKDKITAIVGHTGAGKTTIISLLMRFYDVNPQQILIDNQDIHLFHKHSIRDNYSMILQDSFIFHGTIKENIIYGNQNVTDEMMYEASKKAKIHDFIMKLEQGYETVLVNEGAQLSKGLKQLLVITRAFLSNKRMLIFDEATSSIDIYTEARIHKAMQTLMQEKTVFVIAHRLKTVMNADNILFIENGEILETGTHEELLGRKGKYYELFISQFI
jgi:ATP-binding cassette subfamily B protein